MKMPLDIILIIIHVVHLGKDHNLCHRAGKFDEIWEGEFIT
jgi:hypothetical protein